MSTPLQECYATVTTRFGAGGEFYTNGHRGADYDRDAREPIYAYEDILIESVDYGSGLGWSWGGKILTGEAEGTFAGGAHLWSGSLPREGATIEKGEVIGYVAGFDDVHGSLWTGPHIHTTAGAVSSYNCSVGIRPLYDPAPQIAASIASSSTANSSSTTTITEEESDMLVLRNQKDAGCYMVGPKRIKHLGTSKDLTAAKKVFPYRDLTDAEFRVALIGYQVPYDQAKSGADWSSK